MEDHERKSYIHGGNMGFEYAKEIGKADLADFTGDEWLTFCECICKAYHIEFNKLENLFLFENKC